MAKSAIHTEKSFGLKDTLETEKSKNSAAMAGVVRDSKKSRALPDPCGKTHSRTAPAFTVDRIDHAPTPCGR